MKIGFYIISNEYINKKIIAYFIKICLDIIQIFMNILILEYKFLIITCFLIKIKLN